MESVTEVQILDYAVSVSVDSAKDTNPYLFFELYINSRIDLVSLHLVKQPTSENDMSEFKPTLIRSNSWACV